MVFLKAKSDYVLNILKLELDLSIYKDRIKTAWSQIVYVFISQIWSSCVNFIANICIDRAQRNTPNQLLTIFMIHVFFKLLKSCLDSNNLFRILNKA